MKKTQAPSPLYTRRTGLSRRRERQRDNIPRAGYIRQLPAGKCPSGEMADARDLKSLDGNILRVRVPPRAPHYSISPKTPDAPIPYATTPHTHDIPEYSSGNARPTHTQAARTPTPRTPSPPFASSPRHGCSAFLAAARAARRFRTRYFAETSFGLPFLSATTAL